MTPYEIMLSESQERMLVVAEPGRLKDVQAVCTKWELEAAVVGRVTDDGMFRIKHNGVVVAEIPGQRLVDDCPIYESEAKESPCSGKPPSRRAVERCQGRPPRCPAPAPRHPEYREQALGVRAVRFDGPGLYPVRPGK
jgi:phosphoribosylformylglycinamidine (FGAM) synthase-like enzyme